MEKRLQRAKDKEDLFQELGVKPGSPFNTMKDVFVFSACMGFVNKQREPLKAGKETFGPGVFSKDDEAIMNVIAIADKNDINVLRAEHEEERQTIVEEYANGGIALLKKALQATPGVDLVNELLTLVAQQENGSGNDGDPAQTITKHFGISIKKPNK